MSSFNPIVLISSLGWNLQIVYLWTIILPLITDFYLIDLASSIIVIRKHYVPDSILCILHVLIYLILTTAYEVDSIILTCQLGKLNESN